MFLNLTSPLGGNDVPCEPVHGEILLSYMPHLMIVQLHSKPIHDALPSHGVKPT